MTPTRKDEARSDAPPAPTLRVGLRYFGRLLLLARPYWRGQLSAIMLGTLVGIAGMIPPYLSKLFIDTVYPARDFALLDALAIALLVVTASSTLVTSLQTYYSDVVGMRMARSTELLFFNQLQHMPVTFFDDRAVGEINSRFSDVSLALQTLSNVFRTMLSAGVYLLIVPPILLVMNWRLALVALATAPATGLISALGGNVVRRSWHRTAQMNGELGAFHVEALSHIRTFKSMAAERFLYQAAQGLAETALRRDLRSSGIAALTMLLTGAARGLGLVVFSWYAWTLVVRDQLSVGAFVAFTVYVAYLVGPVAQITDLFSSFQRATVSLNRVFEYLDSPVEQDPDLVRRPAAPMRRAKGELRVVDLAFGYTPDRRVLDGVSLTLRPGTVTAVVGPSGSGKSSLLRLLCRMATPNEGDILLDGVPVSTMPLAELRGQVATVWQEVALLRGTLWYNLTLGLENPSMDAVREVVRMCRLDDLVRELPQGYESQVGEWGAKLSGGQRQRFMIARALLRDTPVLLLDEATSQVDVQTEERILSDVLASTRDKTVLFVTHRVSTAALADQVCVLEQGHIVGLGSHAQLVADCEPYRGMLRVAGGIEMRPRLLGAEG